LLHSCDDFKQGALAGTVLSYKRDAVLLVYYEADISEQIGSAKVNAYVVN
jgi:hypothetical protein